MSIWDWPTDAGHAEVVWLEGYHLRAFSHHGDSAIWKAKERLSEESATPQNTPIAYLIKTGRDALHERLYYVLARALDLPHQIVFWASPFTFREDGAICAIQFEPLAVRPREIDPVRGALYRRAWRPVHNFADYDRHAALHFLVGFTDHAAEVMLRGETIFGIDAAACFLSDAFDGAVSFKWIAEDAHTAPLCDPLREFAQRADLADRLLAERAIVNEFKFSPDHDLIAAIEACARQVEQRQAIARRELK